ncbi:hypothetical protein I5V54_07830 [Stenotrophomonas maltophilia]|nr:hypothetical protein [Stenotrophomonas maltophilia]MBH1843654.1 hypothetical protein [Stenotrophomonas maltophilia]
MKEKRTGAAGDNMKALERERVRAKVLGALNNKKYVARTIAGIADEAHLKSEIVREALRSDPALNELVRVYPRKSLSGSFMVTTQEKFQKRAPFKDKIIDLFASNRPELDDVI